MLSASKNEKRRLPQTKIQNVVCLKQKYKMLSALIKNTMLSALIKNTKCRLP